MANPHGSFIWYELMTPDPDAAKAFYDPLFDWTIDPAPTGPMDYRMIATADAHAGGVMRLTPEMQAGGARPGWLGYIGVDDVDATVDRLRTLGGSVAMAPWDIPGVGRMALVADPQGAHFYVMRGESDQSSTVFAGGAGAPGRVNWNELTTSDPKAAIAFYNALFGWSRGTAMPMGALGTYQMLEHGGQAFGAVTPMMPGGTPVPCWSFYIRSTGVDAAAARIAAGGGTVFHGPAVVPGDDFILIAADPQGAPFALVGPR